MPNTKDFQKTDTAEFSPKTPLPSVTVETEIVESLDKIEIVLSNLKPLHTAVLKDNGPNSVIERLRNMYGAAARDHNTDTNGVAPRVAKPPVASPRVAKSNAKYARINR